MKQAARFFHRLAAGLLVTTLQGLSQPTYTPYTFTTLAGASRSCGDLDGAGGDARFCQPVGIAVDADGNIYVADTGSHIIRRVTTDGTVMTLAGQAHRPGDTDGPGSDARFNFPYGIAVDGSGNVIVGDTANHTIRLMTPDGNVTTLAGLAGNSGGSDGMGEAARFWFPAESGRTLLAISSWQTRASYTDGRGALGFWVERFAVLGSFFLQTVLIFFVVDASCLCRRFVENLTLAETQCKKIESCEEGAFAPVTRQPVVRALLMPFGGAGLVALLQYLASKQ